MVPEEELIKVMASPRLLGKIWRSLYLNAVLQDGLFTLRSARYGVADRDGIIKRSKVDALYVKRTLVFHLLACLLSTPHRMLV